MTTDEQATITLARGAVTLPEPLGSLALTMRDQRLAATDSDGWLLAGRKAGTHITAEGLRDRLKPYGITSRAGRQAALLALAARLPAPILAERIGIHQARAAQWVRAAGATYTHYVALRTSPDRDRWTVRAKKTTGAATARAAASRAQTEASRALRQTPPPRPSRH